MRQSLAGADNCNDYSLGQLADEQPLVAQYACLWALLAACASVIR
jgi:hypothetical protein